MRQTPIRRALMALALAFQLLLLPLAAAAQCEQSCALPPAQERGDCSIVVDANTGRIVAGSIRIPDKCEQVAVYYVNKNPFKYAYTFTSRFVPFDTETALAFLKLIPDFGTTVSSVIEGQPAADLECTGANLTAAQDLTARAEALKAESDRIAALLNSADIKKYTDYRDRQTKFFTDTDDDNAFSAGSASCTGLCARARALVSEFEALPNLDTILENAEKQVKSFEDKVTKLESDLRDFSPTGEEARACRLGVNRLVMPQVGLAKDDIKAYREKLNALQGGKATLEQRAKIIRNGVSSGYIEVVPAQRDDVRGGKLTLAIARKNLRNPDAAVDNREVTLLIGDRSLFLSAGIGFSTISDRRIIRQAGLVPDGNGGTRLATVFGFEENSNFKPSGVFMLNAPLKRFSLFGIKDASLGPSAGLVLSNRNNTVEPEFIVGLSLGLLRDTVFVTGGFHAARRENLAGGFRFGQEIPADLNDPLPIEKNFTGGTMFSITYRIK